MTSSNTHLVDRIEVILHAFDGMVLAILNILGFENFTKSSLTLLGNKPVLPHGGRLLGVGLELNGV